MAYAPQKGDAEVSLSVFGGLVTNQSAATLPEGVSPDNQDVAFLPGSVASRSALQRVFSVPFPQGAAGGATMYAKTFITPTGGIENLYLDRNGNLWFEDVINSPGTYTLLATVAPGSLAKSITAFGREYIAFSDGLHGTDIPLQWDGTNIDRVTQEGPGAAPAVASIALPPLTMANNGSPVAVGITSCTPGNLSNGAYTSFYCLCNSTVTTISTVGNLVTIAGSSVGAYNAQWVVTGVDFASNTLTISASLPSGTAVGSGGTVTPQGGATMTRGGNIVTVYTTTPHQLQVGFQAQISGVTAQTVGTNITSIVINNENQPGIATVTMAAAHGLQPNEFVAISGVVGVAVGGAITAASWSGGIATVTTTTAHGLVPGALVTVKGTGASGVDGTFTVLSVTSAIIFTYLFTPIATVTIALATPTVSINWPIPATATPTYFQVLAAPTSTTFQVSINYSDGTWTTGNGGVTASSLVQFAWNGTFFVSAILTTTAFQYQQYGPVGFSAIAGTVTPWGQAAPGIHQCQVIFLTRQGHTTAPGPPVQFVANGGQYVAVSQIPAGPPNVVARILAFTGAGGSSFFYIPVPAQVNGQQVSTSTQINDNTTTSVLLDFSDPTLFASLATSISGNNLASQIVIDGALGFGLYANRLFAWGQRNRIQNLHSMSFDGGFLPSGIARLPVGWTPGSADDGVIGGSVLTSSAARIGQAWQIRITASGTPFGQLSQSMYRDAYGAQIATPNVTYRLRGWFSTLQQSANFSFFATITSASTSFTSAATISGASIGLGPSGGQPGGAWLEAAFSTAMPATIPSDMTLTIYAQSSAPGIYSVVADELSIIYAQNPYLDTVMYGSYVSNPEGIDGLTGKIGSLQDQHKAMDLADIRQTCYFLTQDPGGRLHQFQDNGTTEPSGWTVNEVAAECGLLSAFSLTKSQADDASAAGGEEWFAWASYVGARIFDGSQPWEISREIRPTWAAINPATLATKSWVLNDPSSRTMYFGLQSSAFGNPALLLVLNYVGLDSAFAIGNTGPIRVSYSGKLIATDHSRKWTRWNVSMNGAALMYRGAGNLQAVLFGSNTLSGGNAYTLNPAKFTDDDLGQISPYYTTYFALSHDQEQGFQVAGYRKLLVYAMAFASSPVACQLQVTPLVDNLTNAWPITATRSLVTAPAYDLEFAGCSAQGNRIALKFASLPLQGQTDNAFNLQRLTAVLRKVARLPVRGAA